MALVAGVTDDLGAGDSAMIEAGPRPVNGLVKPGRQKDGDRLRERRDDFVAGRRHVGADTDADAGGSIKITPGSRADADLLVMSKTQQSTANDDRHWSTNWAKLSIRYWLNRTDTRRRSITSMDVPVEHADRRR